MYPTFSKNKPIKRLVIDTTYKIELTESVRDLIKDKLTKVLNDTVQTEFSNANFNISEIVNNVENYFYDEYENINVSDPEEYLKQMARLLIFLNPNHYVGKYAKLFRNKFIQNIYLPSRLINLDLQEILPEVFLKDFDSKVFNEIYKKQQELKQINNQLEATLNELVLLNNEYSKKTGQLKQKKEVLQAKKQELLDLKEEYSNKIAVLKQKKPKLTVRDKQLEKELIQKQKDTEIELKQVNDQLEDTLNELVNLNKERFNPNNDYSKKINALTEKKEALQAKKLQLELTDKELELLEIVKIYQQLLDVINEEKNILQNEVIRLIYPTAQIKDVKRNYSDLNIRKHYVSVEDICTNPAWEGKWVNYIICKSQGKFYCLDVNLLIQDLAKTGTAKNYYTNEKLPSDIINNLKNRFNNEIEQVKKTGEYLNLNKETELEILYYKDMLENLRQLKIKLSNKLNQDKLLNGNFEDINFLPANIKSVLKSKKPNEIIPELNNFINNNIQLLELNIIDYDLKSPVKASPVKASPVKASPVKASPVKASPVKASPVKESPVKASPVKESPVKESPVKESPVKESPVKASPVKASPVKASPVKASPVKESSVKESPFEEYFKEESPVEEDDDAELEEMYKKYGDYPEKITDTELEYKWRPLMPTYAQVVKENIPEEEFEEYIKEESPIDEIEETEDVEDYGDLTNDELEYKSRYIVPTYADILRQNMRLTDLVEKKVNLTDAELADIVYQDDTTMFRLIFDEFKSRLEFLRQAVLDLIKDSNNKTLLDRLNDIDKNLDKLNKSKESLKGIIELLKSKEKTLESQIAEYQEAISSYWLYPKDMVMSIDEEKNMLEKLRKIRVELKLLQELQK
jgi:hypothetical protein